jgi:hypothetical protein
MGVHGDVNLFVRLHYACRDGELDAVVAGVRSAKDTQAPAVDRDCNSYWTRSLKGHIRDREFRGKNQVPEFLHFEAELRVLKRPTMVIQARGDVADNMVIGLRVIHINVVGETARVVTQVEGLLRGQGVGAGISAAPAGKHSGDNHRKQDPYHEMRV